MVRPTKGCRNYQLGQELYVNLVPSRSSCVSNSLSNQAGTLFIGSEALISISSSSSTFMSR